MAIFGGRPRVRVVVPEVPVPVGAMVQTRVEVSSVDTKVRSGRVELGYRYWGETVVEVQCSDDDCDRAPPFGSHTHPETRWDSVWCPVAGHPLVLEPLAPASLGFSFRLPPEGPPTVTDLVAWQVRVGLERSRGLDVRQEAPLVVVRDTTVPLPCEDEPPSSTGRTPMTVSLERRRVHRGAWVVGEVTAHPVTPVRTRGLRAQLVRERRQTETGSREVEVESQVPITGAFQLVPGAPFRVPFAVRLPDDAAPCVVTPRATQHWYLEIVVDVPMAADETTRVPLGVG